MGYADQLHVIEHHAGAHIAVIQDDFHTGCLQVCVKLFSRFPDPV